MISEILIICSHIILKTLIPDPHDQLEENRINIGWAFIAFCILVLFLQLVFLIYTFLIPLIKYIKRKLSNKKN